MVPVWELEVSTHENLQITLAFTVLSVVRGFIWRRIFNYREKAIIVEDMQLREMLRDSYKENSRLLGVQHHLSQSLKELEGMRINNER